MMYYLSFLITVLGLIAYHVAMKKTPAGVNPFMYLIVAYLLAAVFCVPGLFLSAGSKDIKTLDWSVVGVALGVFGIEVGFLLSYRAGWNVGYTALLANTLSTILLLPYAVFVLKDGVTLSKLIGVVLCLAGLTLLVRVG